MKLAASANRRLEFYKCRQLFIHYAQRKACSRRCDCAQPWLNRWIQTALSNSEKHSQLFIGVNDETLSVAAMRVNNKDPSGFDASPRIY
jgi:hypothetical protein